MRVTLAEGLKIDVYRYIEGKCSALRILILPLLGDWWKYEYLFWNTSTRVAIIIIIIMIINYVSYDGGDINLPVTKYYTERAHRLPRTSLREVSHRLYLADDGTRGELNFSLSLLVYAVILRIIFAPQGDLSEWTVLRRAGFSNTRCINIIPQRGVANFP